MMNYSGEWAVLEVLTLHLCLSQQLRPNFVHSCHFFTEGFAYEVLVLWRVRTLVWYDMLMCNLASEVELMLTFWSR